VTRIGVVGASTPSSFACTSGIAWVWVFTQPVEAWDADARHKEAVAAPARRRHLEIDMVLDPSLIPADNDVSSGWFPMKPIFLKISFAVR
jgi:hypothetical protein